MRFKVDENLHDDVALLLAGDGHDVETVYSEGLRGSDDSVVAQHCRAEGRAIVTLDLDFADIRAYPPADYPGFIVLRLSEQSRRRVLSVMRHVVDAVKRETLINRLWIASEASIRIRGG